eukprot:g116.t1
MQAQVQKHRDELAQAKNTAEDKEIQCNESITEEANEGQTVHSFKVSFMERDLGLCLGMHNEWDCGAIVGGFKEMNPPGPAEACGKIKEGQMLIGINGTSTLKLTFRETVAVLQETLGKPGVPIHLEFALKSDVPVIFEQNNVHEYNKPVENSNNFKEESVIEESNQDTATKVIEESNQDIAAKKMLNDVYEYNKPVENSNNFKEESVIEESNQDTATDVIEESNQDTATKETLNNVFEYNEKQIENSNNVKEESIIEESNQDTATDVIEESHQDTATDVIEEWNQSTATNVIEESNQGTAAKEKLKNVFDYIEKQVEDYEEESNQDIAAMETLKTYLVSFAYGRPIGLEIDESIKFGVAARVTYVKETNPPRPAVEVGQIVVEINGTSTLDLTFAETVALFKNSFPRPGEPMRVRFADECDVSALLRGTPTDTGESASSGPTETTFALPTLRWPF